VPKLITVYDDVCPWPYAQPYGEVQVKPPPKPRKPRRKRVKFSEMPVTTYALPGSGRPPT
jgi:hypothetical protein